jgi:DNA-binding NtrC family response regulator
MQPAELLVIEDDDLTREQMCTLLEDKGYDCTQASTGEEGLENARNTHPDVILLDLKLPGERSGTEMIDDLLSSAPECFLFVITGKGDMDSAIQSFRAGASDFIQKPFQLEPVHQKIQTLMSYREAEEENRQLRRKLTWTASADTQLIGESEATQEIRHKISQVATTDSTVLITGESGTGKEVIARLIHEQDETSGEFIGLNCAGIPDDLLESELFGHEKGAFTGASERREGYFETAPEDTILLDEIGDMPARLQAKLLRALEEREFYRVGGDELIPLKARVLATTNRDLETLVEEGNFREDLYYRLSVFTIQAPPLTERKTDIPILANHFIERYGREMNKNCQGLTESALQTMMSHDWPGNVRELRNAIEHAMIELTGSDDRIDETHLPDQVGASAAGTRLTVNEDESASLDDAMDRFQQQYITAVLEQQDWDKEDAADRLDIDLSTLYRKINRLEIEPAE